MTPLEDAERAIIGAVFQSNHALERVTLKPRQFSHPARQLLWTAILELDSREKPIDPITLPEQLNGRGADHVIAELSECLRGGWTVDNVEFYVDIVAAHSKDRELRHGLADALGDKGLDTEELRGRVERILARGAPPAIPEPTPGSQITWVSTHSIFEPLPPTNWVFKELGICPGRPSMIAGYGYSGKTLAGQALLLAAAAGVLAWGQFPTGRQMRVRHLDFEQGRHATLKRYQRLARGAGIVRDDLGDRLEVAIFPPAALNAQDAADTYARESEGCDLVLLDSLAGATPGEAENESQMRGYIDMLSRVTEKTGAVFTLIHHAGKLTENHSKDPRTIVRGHSGIFDACGNVLIFSGEKSGPVLVRQVKAPAEAEGKAIDPFYLEIEDVGGEAGQPGGVRIVHKAAEDQVAELKDAAADASAARTAAKVAKLEAEVPEMAERIWKALRRAAARSVRTRSSLVSLVTGSSAVVERAITKLQTCDPPRIVLARSDQQGGGRWYEAV